MSAAQRSTALRDRAAGLFIAPREGVASPEPVAALTRFAPRAAVLGSPREAPPVAAALACALRRRERSPAALVAIWSDASSGQRPASRPATPAASRLAARLTARGVAAAPRGRLAWAVLHEPPAVAALALRRLHGAVEVPLVVALTGPRADALDEVLGDQELVVVVARDPEGPLARLALAGLDGRALACAPLAGSARVLALAGFGGQGVLAEPVRAALRAGP